MRCLLKVSQTFPLLAIVLMAATGLAAQGSSTVPSVTLPGNQNPFLGSEPEAKPTPDILQIDYKEAIDRGLRHNLGLLLSGDQTETARGERWKELAELLPNISARVQENVQTQSLAAIGFNKLFPLLAAPGTNAS